MSDGAAPDGVEALICEMRAVYTDAGSFSRNDVVPVRIYINIPKTNCYLGLKRKRCWATLKLNGPSYDAIPVLIEQKGNGNWNSHPIGSLHCPCEVISSDVATPSI